MKNKRESAFLAAANHDRGRDVRARSGVRLATAPHAVEDGACFSYYVGRKENTQREREREREREKAITITIRYADRAIIRFVGCYRLHADVTNKKQNTNASYGNGRRSHDERSFLFLSFSSNETKKMRSKKKKKSTEGVVDDDDVAGVAIRRCPIDAGNSNDAVAVAFAGVSIKT